MSRTVATIISVYKCDDYKSFAIALDSIFEQQFLKDIESRVYLAVDGPVPDEINNVIIERQERIYHISRIKINVGLASALNTLISNLHDEEFIFRMDSDDVSCPQRYQTQLDYLDNHTDIDILGTDIIEVDVTNGTRRHVVFSKNQKDALNNLCRRVPVAHPTVCFRRRVLDRVGGYPVEGTNEDISLWFKCAQEGFKFDNVHVPLLEFKIGQDFWKRRSIKKSFSELKCYVTGIWQLHGITWKYIYPMMRFVLRVSPHWVSRLAYGSFLRR